MAADHQESYFVSELKALDWLRRQYLVELDGPVDFDIKYQNLRPGQIRLLEVWPGEPDEPLRYSIHVAIRDRDVEADKLYKPIEYEAISYVWGNPERNVELKCDRANWVIGRPQSKEDDEHASAASIGSAAETKHSEEPVSFSGAGEKSSKVESEPSDAQATASVEEEEGSPYAEAATNSDAESDSNDRVALTIYAGDFDAQATTITITQSAYRLLHRLRDAQDAKILWVDGICINQDDHDERAAQVAMMKDIYASATQVLIWLGEDTADTIGAFYIVRKLATILNERDWTEKEARERAEWPGFRPWQLPQDHALHLDHNAWLAFKTKLLYLPWFQRTWVFQELALSRQATVVWGSERVAWKTLSDACDAVTELSIVIGNHHRHLMVQKINERADAYERLQQILSQRHGTLYIEDIRALSLRLLLWDARALQATDPRDKVYGIFGLAIMRQDAPIQISYTAPVRDLYTRTCEYFPSMRHLECLSWVQEAELELCLPSWVPDWSTTQPISSIASTKAAIAKEAKYKILWNHITESSFCMKRWGKPVACHCLQVQGVQLMEVGTLVNRSDDDQQAEVLNSLPAKYPMTNVSYLDVYSKIFEPVKAPDFQLGGLRDVQQSFWDVRRSGMPEGGVDKPRTADDHVSILASQLNKMRPFGVHIVPTTAATERPMWDYRSVFASSSGFMGSVPRGTVSGDKIVLFMGAAVPFVVRQFESHFLLIGVMDGEALENLDPGRIEDFVLC